MLTNRSRLLLLIVFALIVAVIFVGLYDFPKRIDLENPAVVNRDDASSSTTTTIMIKGTIYRPLFRNATFRGQFIIDDYEFTKTHELIDVSLIKNGDLYKGGLAYTTVIDGKPDLVLLGMLAMEGHFDKLSIIVNRQLTDDSQFTTITAPADNLEMARSISNALSVSFEGQPSPQP